MSKGVGHTDTSYHPYHPCTSKGKGNIALHLYGQQWCSHNLLASTVFSHPLKSWAKKDKGRLTLVANDVNESQGQARASEQGNHTWVFMHEMDESRQRD